MSFRFEPQNIVRGMLGKSNYQINAQYNGEGAVISRNFNGVIYNLYFENRGGSFEGFNLGTNVDKPGFGSPATGGEKCTTPGYILKKNVFAMIDDLPLTAEQKKEMKKNVWIVPTSTLKLF